MRRKTRTLAILMSFIMVLTTFSLGTVFAETEAPPSDGKYEVRLESDYNGILSLLTYTEDENGDLVQSADNRFSPGQVLYFRVVAAENTEWFKVTGYGAIGWYPENDPVFIDMTDNISDKRVQVGEWSMFTYKITMPDCNAVVRREITVKTLKDEMTEISVADTEHGKVSVDYTKVPKGESVTVSYEADEGYRIGDLYALSGERRINLYNSPKLQTSVEDQVVVYAKFVKEESVDQIIHNAEEFCRLASDANNGREATFGKRYQLGADLDLTGCEYAPFSTFNGILDGNQKTISGVTVNLIDTLQNGSVLNLTLKGEISKEKGTYSVAFANHMSDSLMENCVSLVTVTSQSFSYTGGLIGSGNGLLKNCVNRGDVTGETVNSSAMNRVGGIAGSFYGVIEGSSNYGNVTGKMAGGLIGYAGPWGTEAFSVESCANYGEISASENAGGLVGYSEMHKTPSIRNSANKGDVSARRTDDSPRATAAGILGKQAYTSSSSPGLIVENCYNTGAIYAENPTIIPFAAGIFGTEYTTDDDSHNTQWMSSVSMKNCYNNGTISRGGQEANAETLIGELFVDVMYEAWTDTHGSDNRKDFTYEHREIDGDRIAAYNNCYRTADLEKLSAEEAAKKLGEAFKADNNGVNENNTPLLSWESEEADTSKYALSFTVSESVPYALKVFDQNGTEVHAEDGVYQLSNGTYRYTVEAEGYVPVSQTVSIKGKNKNISVVLKPASRVTVQMTPPDASLVVTDPMGNTQNPAEDSLYLLAKGETYTYQAVAEGYLKQRKSFTPAENQETLTISLTATDYGANGQYIWGNQNTGKVNTISQGGTYSIANDASGRITVATSEPVVLLGRGILNDEKYTDLSVDASGQVSKVTLKDVYIDKTASFDTEPMVNFTGTGNQLKIEGICLLDNHGSGQGTYAVVHVPQGSQLTIGGSGTLYSFKSSGGTNIGGNTGELNGDITFDLSGKVFLKGTKQGAVIGAGADTGRVSGSPGAIRFVRGEYNLIANARGAAIGGGAGSSGGSSGTAVYVEPEANININVDYSGAAVGGAGYDGGNDSSGGKLFVNGGSLRVYLDSNAANNTNWVSWNGKKIEAGLNDAAITAQRLNGKEEAVYRLVLDTAELTGTADQYTIFADGQTEPFYKGGLHKFGYIQETLDREADEQLSITDTLSNWNQISDTCLYLYMTGEDHLLQVNGQTVKGTWNEETESFTVEVSEPSVPNLEVVNYTEASGGSSPATVAFSDNGTDFTVKSEQACAVMLQKADGTVQTLKATASGDAYAYSAEGAAEGDRIVVALKGDTNLDGEMDLFDVIELKAASMGKTTLNDIQKVVSDVVVDKEIDVFDVIELKAASMGKTSLNWQ